MRKQTLTVLLGGLVCIGLTACGESGGNPLAKSGSGSGGLGSSSGAIATCPTPVPIATQKEKDCSQRNDPRITAMSDVGISLTSSLGLAAGRYAMPANANPSQLVIMFHGHGNDSCSWRNHLRDVAARGAIAVSMDYTGQIDKEVEGFGRVDNYGWFIRSGVADSIAAARYFMDKYPSITKVYNFGASMGGNASGYATYAPAAVRADCSPLWDYWIAGEGVHNLTEEYLGTRTLAPVLTSAGIATKEIEEENGGTLEAKPAHYAEITTVQNSGKMGYLKGVVLTHGTNDQTVPVDQTNQMAQALKTVNVPAYVFLIQGSDHVWEGSSTLGVMRYALSELYRIMDGGVVVTGQATVAGP